MKRNRKNIFLGGLILALLSVLWAAWKWFPSPKESGYRFALQWGETGAGPGEFDQPIGIAIAGDEVFVSDAGNHRIQVFDREGTFLRSFGSEGDEPGELSRPMHLDIRNGKLYVAEYLNDQIQVFSPEGESLRLIAPSNSDEANTFDAPGGVAVDDAGRLYVADFYHHRVLLLASDGKVIRKYGATGQKGIRAGKFNYPTDVALSPGGGLLVADAYNDRVQSFDSVGNFLRKWGGPLALNISGGANGWFRTATGVHADSAGNVFVADFYNHRIQKFTAKGRFLATFGEPGNGPGQFDRPTDVAVDSAGNVYVVDFGNNRVQKFAPVETNPE